MIIVLAAGMEGGQDGPVVSLLISLRIITLQGKKKLLFGNGGNMGNLNCNSVANGVIEFLY
jgi:hypothetical protein